jgi:hypothetical protein
LEEIHLQVNHFHVFLHIFLTIARMHSVSFTHPYRYLAKIFSRKTTHHHHKPIHIMSQPFNPPIPELLP